ncbi:uncharacterized protein BJ171DRAFT_493887 [Polychytrium aggregatum]|uniref:uncharacterized protein n=1 Tax=Polychytrium aggregatum TaxID=110093 RepID=UPI0022FDD4B0|nr:uncharacterized protein BJ171DRAFT_493887 [Polychytrium aggregatum]KAI9207205.1 hypothetical protein BJ171DRAFT_493887 [Polychytrium aggregatum]
MNTSPHRLDQVPEEPHEKDHSEEPPGDSASSRGSQKDPSHARANRSILQRAESRGYASRLPPTKEDENEASSPTPQSSAEPSPPHSAAPTGSKLALGRQTSHSHLGIAALQLPHSGLRRRPSTLDEDLYEVEDPELTSQTLSNNTTAPGTARGELSKRFSIQLDDEQAEIEAIAAAAAIVETEGVAQAVQKVIAAAEAHSLAASRAPTAGLYRSTFADAVSKERLAHRPSLPAISPKVSKSEKFKSHDRSDAMGFGSTVRRISVFDIDPSLNIKAAIGRYDPYSSEWGSLRKLNQAEESLPTEPWSRAPKNRFLSCGNVELGPGHYNPPLRYLEKPPNQPSTVFMSKVERFVPSKDGTKLFEHLAPGYYSSEAIKIQTGFVPWVKSAKDHLGRVLESDHSNFYEPPTMCLGKVEPIPLFSEARKRRDKSKRDDMSTPSSNRSPLKLAHPFSECYFSKPAPPAKDSREIKLP